MDGLGTLQAYEFMYLFSIASAWRTRSIDAYTSSALHGDPSLWRCYHWRAARFLTVWSVDKLCPPHGYEAMEFYIISSGWQARSLVAWKGSALQKVTKLWRSPLRRAADELGPWLRGRHFSPVTWTGSVLARVDEAGLLQAYKAIELCYIA